MPLKYDCPRCMESDEFESVGSKDGVMMFECVQCEHRLNLFSTE